MGLFSTGATAESGPKASTDGAFQAPSRTERAHCWEARDAFFKCLDHHSIIDSIKEHSLAGERCGKEGQAFERDCASSWVSRKEAMFCETPFDDGIGSVL
jgi:cytochrome c oxidase assembly factor 6